MDSRHLWCCKRGCTYRNRIGGSEKWLREVLAWHPPGSGVDCQGCVKTRMVHSVVPALVDGVRRIGGLGSLSDNKFKTLSQKEGEEALAEERAQ